MASTYALARRKKAVDARLVAVIDTLADEASVQLPTMPAEPARLWRRLSADERDLLNLELLASQIDALVAAGDHDSAGQSAASA